MKSYLKTIFISLVVSISTMEFCLAQKANFRYFSVDEGLPQATVYEMLLDNEGYLWFGTQGGLSRFDGKNFEVYNQEKGLAENHVIKLYQDSKNNIWIGYRYEGISKWDGTKFEHYKNKLSGINKSISDIIEDDFGNIWLGTKGNGIYVLGFDRNDSLYSIMRLTDENGIGSNNITSLERDESGNIWIGTNEGICIINPGNRDKILKTFPLSGLEFKTNYVSDIKITGLNSAFVATLSGFCNLTFDSDFNIRIKNKYENSKENPIQDVKKLHFAGDSSLWLATANGAIRYKEGVFKRFTDREGLSNNNVSSIIEDREGNIWIGVWGSGVCQYLGDNFEVYDKETGLIDNMVHAVIADKVFTLWVGTQKGITRCFFSDTLMNTLKSVMHITIDDGLSDNDVNCLYQDSRDYIWIGTKKGVARYDPAKKSFINYAKDNELVRRRIISINEDKNGNIWLCDLGTGCTKFTIDQKSGKVISSEQFTKENGFFSSVIWIVYKDIKGDLWFGSDDAGLAVYDGENFKTINEEQVLTHKRPAAITEDIYGNLWIGSIGGGVYKFNPSAALGAGGNKFTNYTTKDGISADNPYIVIGDDIGNVWMGTNTGVDKLKVNTGEVWHYGKSEGFTGIETNQNAVYKDYLGNIWFGTIKGLVKCSPSSFKTNLVEPITAIKKVRVFLKDENIPENNTFPYYKNHLTFDFTGISYSNPERVEFQYMLEGFDKEWSPLTRAHSATYSNIPPGRFRFFLRACNSDGIWNKKPVVFAFEVTPPFWQTWWFYTICFLVVAGAVTAFIKIRERNLRKEKKILEEKVKQRTVLITKQKEELAEKNKDITDSIHYAQNIQQAMLPADEQINNLLPDSFVLFRPKDIVSGDFYWLANIPHPSVAKGLPKAMPDPLLKKGEGELAHGSPTIVFAVCDCTGHGVPGAFISMLINSLLNEIVNDLGITKPGEILDEVRKGIINSLKQKRKIGAQKDGMDAVLCSIEYTNHTSGGAYLQYAGANNPLFIIRKNKTPLTNDAGEEIPPVMHAKSKSATEAEDNSTSLYEIKPDKQSVGFNTGEEHPFTNHQIRLLKGDIIYAFSDGFKDQFGGPKGKKFMIKRQKQLFLDIQDKNMQEQKKILNKTIDTWKGNAVQVDDMLVIGVRV